MAEAQQGLPWSGVDILGRLLMYLHLLQISPLKHHPPALPIITGNRLWTAMRQAPGCACR